MSKPEKPVMAGNPRRDDIQRTLKAIVGNLTGIDSKEINIHTTFLEMGADSLSLLQVSKEIQDSLGLKVHFRLLLEDLGTVDALTDYIDNELPAEERPAATRKTESAPDISPTAPPLKSPDGDYAATASRNGPNNGEARHAQNSALEHLLTQQLQIMSQQLVLLGKGEGKGVGAALPQVAASAPPVGAPAEVRPTLTQSSGATSETDRLTAVEREHESQARSKKNAPQPFVAYQPHQGGGSDDLSPRQQQHLAALITRVNDRTRGSKQRTQASRACMADSRAPAGFRLLWKELCYPLIIERADGARAWDVDGHSYIDLTMGFGALLFGHSPPFLVRAMQEQLARGLQLGWQSSLAGKVSALISELTGVERVAFCNSGTEAVMSALRLARTVTGRTGIALFAGSYHGTFDGVLVRAGARAADGEPHALPLAPGVPQHMIENVLVLDYGSPESLRILKERMHELAAVLVEPSQSRRPDLQPRVFLHALREMTRAAGTALIFDEVITGFRIHPGGAQAVFDVQADLVTYGKSVGAGVPIGVLAGTAQFMDTIDGGMWHYGDASYPQVETTLYAGTYFKHPLVMAAAWAVLNHIKESGPALQRQLNERTSALVETLNQYFETEQLSVRVANFGSLFRFVYPTELRFMNLFYYHLLARGVYICETRTCFLSTAHTDEDIAHVIEAVKESVDEMRAGGFLPERTPVSPEQGPPARWQSVLNLAPGAAVSTSAGAAAAAPPSGARTAPTTEAQKGLWVLARMSDEASCAYNESINVRLKGRLKLTTLRRAIQKVVERHEALRTTFSADGAYQLIPPALALEVPLTDLSGAPRGSVDARLDEWLVHHLRQKFDLHHGPPIRVGIAKLGEGEHLLSIVVHHIVTDGWSFDVLRQEVGELYRAECEGIPAQLAPPMQFSDYAEWQAGLEQCAAMAAAESYWLTEFTGAVEKLELPADRPRPPLQTYNGARSRAGVEADLCRELKGYGASRGCTLFVVLLAAFMVLLSKLTRQRDIVVGTHSAGQSTVGGQNLIGFCINMLPLRSLVDEQQTFKEYLVSVRKKVLDAQQHQMYPISRLIKKLKLVRDPSRPPLVNVVCNMDRIGAAPELSGLDVSLVECSTVFARFDLLWNMLEKSGEVMLDCTYNADLFDAGTVRGWTNDYLRLLHLICEQPDITLGEMTNAGEQVDARQRAAESSALREAGHETFKHTRRKPVSPLN